MKTATYHTTDGKTIKIEYDENAPCMVCGEPVVEASMSGTVICPTCDCGICRYCNNPLHVGKDREDTLRKTREHIALCKKGKHG